ncbi:hypothetical protein HNQ07_002920 [Deinococcus metalli]|uniref:Uncharacterized protein n=1 Tax=Deinococcus metalli TaxID=1141878 RepID=A0A7W8KGL8_9DEIO|nr:hypothetical protein [Deinococcus metalli]MBB5377428.1 hypothetical protein [Deinococcus metalli]GHF50341.1 hypothetical protein GCM10017781_28560 [Deinococcus metalli]
MHRALILAALTLVPAAGVAGAQSLSVNISASVQFPPVVQTLSNVVSFLSQGVQVTFLTTTAQPVASLNPQGGIVVRPAYPTTTRITQVQVMTATPTGTIREIYPLAQPVTVSRAQPLAPQSIVVRDRDGRRRTLTEVMGRQAAWKKARGLQKKPGGMPPGQYKKEHGHK